VTQRGRNAYATSVEEISSPPASATLGAGVRGTLKALLSATILALLAYIIDWPALLEIVKGARLEMLILAASLLVLGNALIAWRWQLLLAPVGIQTTVGQALQSYLKGHFAAHFLPSGVAGDVIKAVDMHGAQDPGRRKVGVELAASVFIERGFGAITVGLAVLLGLALSPLAGDHESLGRNMSIAAAAIMACCALALFADKFLAVLPDTLLRRAPRNLRALVRRAHVSLLAYRDTPGRLAGVMFLSVIVQALRILPVFFIGLALGAGAGFFAYLIAVPIIFLSAMLPIVGSRVGTEQGMFVLFLGLAGVAPEAALAIALVSLALSILVSLPGGYWLIKGRAKQRHRPQAVRK
jgi:glycosyltransferase 2 family protein